MITHPVLRNDLEDSDLFTGALYNNYGPPNGFCFDILCDDEPIIDNKHSPDYNVDRRVRILHSNNLLCKSFSNDFDLVFTPHYGYENVYQNSLIIEKKT